MTRIDWGKAGERLFEAGCDRGVFYPRLGAGVPWNGLVSVNENLTGGEVEPLYFDGVKYMDLAAAEDFEAQIEAFSTPREFAACEGTRYLAPGLSVGQQPRAKFDFCYRTLVGNDLEGTDFAYKIHLVYNCTATPSGRSSKTLAGRAEAETRTWKINTVPPPATTYRPSAHIVLSSNEIDPYTLQNIEALLYGRDAANGSPPIVPHLPSIEDIVRTLDSKVTALVQATV